VIFSKNFLFALGILGLLSPYTLFANGGDQRVVDGRYFINLSRAPFTPRVGVKTAMLPSFFDIEKNKLVAEDLLVKVRIYRFGDSGEEKRVPLFEKKDILVKGGVLEGLSYTFVKPGLHEIFFDFAFAENPKKIYEVPDFLLDVQEPEALKKDTALVIVLTTIISVIIGGAIGWMIGRKYMGSINM
jgi:hypothetical protein